MKLCFTTNLLNNRPDLFHVDRCPVPLLHEVLETSIQLFKYQAAASPITEMFVPSNDVALVRIELPQLLKYRYLVIYKSVLEMSGQQVPTFQECLKARISRNFCKGKLFYHFIFSHLCSCTFP